MTGMYDQVRPGIGHNQPDEYAEEKKHQKWERWAKKRTFVRALEGTYSHLYKALLEEKRVYPSQEVPWKPDPSQLQINDPVVGQVPCTHDVDVQSPRAAQHHQS